MDYYIKIDLKLASRLSKAIRLIICISQRDDILAAIWLADIGLTSCPLSWV